MPTDPTKHRRYSLEELLGETPPGWKLGALRSGQSLMGWSQEWYIRYSATAGPGRNVFSKLDSPNEWHYVIYRPGEPSMRGPFRTPQAAMAAADDGIEASPNV